MIVSANPKYLHWQRNTIFTRKWIRGLMRPVRFEAVYPQIANNNAQRTRRNVHFICWRLWNLSYQTGGIGFKYQALNITCSPATRVHATLCNCRLVFNKSDFLLTFHCVGRNILDQLHEASEKRFRCTGGSVYRSGHHFTSAEWFICPQRAWTKTGKIQAGKRRKIDSVIVERFINRSIAEDLGSLL
jgi:hypothetical protein